ncbi:MAG: hypothetical protein K6T83_14080, partial [Alicyclobacillus sp.]|nr:hypothetical protein [Alicyclobacillus sp.]
GVVARRDHPLAVVAKRCEVVDTTRVIHRSHEPASAMGSWGFVRLQSVEVGLKRLLDPADMLNAGKWVDMIL